jgi:nucleoid-associated protein YgaU
VEPGIYSMRVDQVEQAGKVASRLEMPFSRAKPEDLKFGPDGRSVVVQPGNSLWRIARHIYGEGLRYTEIYRANQAQIADPDLIYPGQIFSVPQEANGAAKPAQPQQPDQGTSQKPQN